MIMKKKKITPRVKKAPGFVLFFSFKGCDSEGGRMFNYKSAGITDTLGQEIFSLRDVLSP